MVTDIRWKQRFNNYVKSLRHLKRMAELAKKRPLSEDERTLMVKYFEMSQQLSFNVLRDYLWHQGVLVDDFPKKIIRESFARDLIADSQAWIDILEERNKAAHVYNEEIAQELGGKILDQFYPALVALEEDFQKRYEQED